MSIQIASAVATKQFEKAPVPNFALKSAAKSPDRSKPGTTQASLYIQNKYRNEAGDKVAYRAAENYANTFVASSKAPTSAMIVQMPENKGYAVYTRWLNDFPGASYDQKLKNAEADIIKSIVSAVIKQELPKGSKTINYIHEPSKYRK